MKCPKCGKKVDKKAFLCPHCGASVSSASAYRRPSVWLAVMIVALIAVLCSIGIHLWRNNSGNTPNAEIISTEDANKMLELVDDIQALDKQEADAEDIYAYLSSLDWIESICHEEDGGISCRTEFGVTAVWSDDMDNSYIGGESTVGNEEAKGMEIVEKFAGDGLDIVILCPYASVDDSFILDGYEAAANMAAEASTGSVTVLVDDEVSLEVLKHLDKYDMVLFYSHGLLSSIANSAWAIYESDPYTMTGEFADSVAAYIALSSDWFYGRTIIDLSTGRIGIGGNFYKHYYEENSMENMFFHFGSCCSMHSSTIADALISRGAVWVEGWSSNVRFDNDFMHIWGMLTCLSLGYTAGESADCVLTSEETQKYAQEDCRFVTVGDESYQISIATDEDSLDNNDGDFADLDSVKSYRIPAGSLSLYPWNDEGTVLLYGETVYKDVYNIGSGPMQTSMDCSKILLESYTENGSFSLLSENGEIVTIDRGTAAHFTFSLDGSTVLYVSWDRDLVLFDVNTSQKTTVCHEDAFFGTLSPDGTQVLYATGWYDETVIYRYDGETSIKIGEGYTPISISDDGKCIYAYQVEENALYTFDESGEWKKISDEPSNVFLSSDYTEILFHADAKTYISTNGGEKEMISASKIEPLSWFNLTFTEYGGYCDPAVCNSSLFDQIYVTGDFYSSDYIYTNEYDSKYSDSSDFYYISPRYAAERIASNVECFAASVDYSTVYYISGGKLYHASSADAYASEEIAAEGTAAHVYISDYGETAYYLTADGVLYCIESDGSSDKISGGVETVAGFYNGYFYFTTSDNTLYYASQAAKTEVSSNVYSCFVSATGAYYVTADSNLYGSESGTQFSCLLSSHDGDYEEPDNTVESTDTLAYEMRKEVIEFTLSDGTLYYQNVIEYPYFLGNSAVETIINSRYASLIQKCKETTRDFDAEYEELMALWDGYSSGLPFYDDVLAEVTYCGNGYVSIKECSATWSSNMRAYLEYSGYTYRISDGTELGVSDFLSGSDAENEKLVTKYKQGIVDYFDANIVMASPFVLTEEGLCFICPEDDSPWDSGSRVEVIIPYSELSMSSP